MSEDSPVIAPVVVAGHNFVTTMLPRADAHDLSAPLWYGWALLEAFQAGARWQAVQTAEPLTEQQRIDMENLGLIIEQKEEGWSVWDDQHDHHFVGFADIASLLISVLEFRDAMR